MNDFERDKLLVYCINYLVYAIAGFKLLTGVTGPVYFSITDVFSGNIP